MAIVSQIYRAPLKLRELQLTVPKSLNSGHIYFEIVGK